MGGGGKSSGKSRNLAKNCMNLKELRLYCNILWKIQEYFIENPKLGGGTNELKSVEKSKIR